MEQKVKSLREEVKSLQENSDLKTQEQIEETKKEIKERKKEIKERIKKIKEINELSPKIQAQINKLKGDDKGVAIKLRESLSTQKVEGLLPGVNTEIFKWSCDFIARYRKAFPNAKPADIFTVVDANQNKLLHQERRSMAFRTGSDHGILHILQSNMNIATNFFEGMTAKEQVLAMQIIIDHDM
ncbi:MAG: hypothetical protein LBG52_02135 [Candidatus Peribacteria bacterium]|nr:hypothetical protein [Candidatus Peribacteria bacterium]